MIKEEVQKEKEEDAKNFEKQLLKGGDFEGKMEALKKLEDQ